MSNEGNDEIVGEVQIAASDDGFMISAGNQSPLRISATDLMVMARLLPTYFRRFLAQKSAAGSGLSAIAPAQVTFAEVNEELLGGRVHLDAAEFHRLNYQALA